MTASTTVATSSSPRPDRVDAGGVLRSEWTKLRSVRSTWWTLAATFGTMVGFGALFSAAFVARYDRLDEVERLRIDPTLHSLRGIYLAQLAIGVLGVLAITNEYVTGMIRNTFASVPQRHAVLLAKAADLRPDGPDRRTGRVFHRLLRGAVDPVPEARAGGHR